LVKTPSFWKVPCQPSRPLIAGRSGVAWEAESDGAEAKRRCRCRLRQTRTPYSPANAVAAISDLQFPLPLYAVLLMSNNYHPYTTAAPPRPVIISLFDNPNFLICRPTGPVGAVPSPVGRAGPARRFGVLATSYVAAARPAPLSPLLGGEQGAGIPPRRWCWAAHPTRRSLKLP